MVMPTTFITGMTNIIKGEIKMNSTQTISTADSTVSKGTGISGSTLKIIAIIAMFIDHIGATILERLLLRSGYTIAQAIPGGMDNWMSDPGNAVLLYGYYTMRLIGRFGFPLFCFLLVEGFIHTRSRAKYALRLFLFCLISEVPFDLAIKGEYFNPDYQNVFFTLLLGFLAMCAYDYIQKRISAEKPLFQLLPCLGVLAVAMVAAELLKTDYAAMGVLTISVMYLYRFDKFKSMLWGCIVLTFMSIMEATAFLMLIPISKYNGKRGLNIKYFFYAFYPVHLGLLYLVCKWMGLV